MSDFQINGVSFPSPIIKTRPDEVKPVADDRPEGGTTFGEVLENAILQVGDAQNEAGKQAQQLMVGNAHDIHSTMVAIQKADISFQLMMQVRNKIVLAYQEIMRSQV